MNIERTIQFILESQAKAEMRMDRWEERADRSDARVAAMEKRLDRRMDAITKLLQQGMRILVKNQTEIAEIRKAQRCTDNKLAELAEAQKELAQAQKETQRALRAFIASLRNGRNGRWSRKRENENIAGSAGVKLRRKAVEAGAHRDVLLAANSVGDRISSHRRAEIDLP